MNDCKKAYYSPQISSSSFPLTKSFLEQEKNTLHLRFPKTKEKKDFGHL